VPRNVLPFFNRGAPEFRVLFWDGRVQQSATGEIETPLGKRMPSGFENPLAAASVFPLAEPDEMLGRSLTRVRRGQHHNDLVGPEVDGNNLQDRTLHAFSNVIRRVIAPDQKRPDKTVLRYRQLFQAAYPGTRDSEFGIHHIGNALSAYITAAFALQPAAWDRYVAGDWSALTKVQKEGAIVFFGKGRCAVCHSGVEFSDFQFHSLAIPQLNVGKHSKHIDYGRAAATSRGQDRFAFRTPPLRNVTETGPWGHNGLFSSLNSAVEHHFNPVPVLHRAQQQFPEESAHAGRLLGFRSPILAEIAPLSTSETQSLVSFLSALTSSTFMSSDVAVPADVPSGNREFIRH